MKRHFCTLFDKNFLTRGLALHQSLMEQCPEFILSVLCMDDESFEMLERLALSHVRTIRLVDIEKEDEELLAIKPTRTRSEYCWTFSSILPLYILTKNPEIEIITYLDADMYFYAPLENIYQSFGDNSILIIEHRFSEKNKYKAKTSGIYNVGMMLFRNDQNGIECLKWWRARCIEWCFDHYEDGKLGDQLYLNDWTTRFKGVFVLTEHGADVASWNMDRYHFTKKNRGFLGFDKESRENFPLIFYHFHGLKIYGRKNMSIRAYPITVYESAIYKTYTNALAKAYRQVQKMDQNWHFGLAPQLDILRFIKQYIGQYARRII